MLHHPHTLSKKNYMFHPNMKTCHFQTRKYNKTSKTSLKRHDLALLRSTMGHILNWAVKHVVYKILISLLQK